MKIDRQHLVAICVDLFRRNGYHRTSMEDVAVACGLRKASLYHHFPSKETLALAALEQEHEWYTENVFRCALRRDLPPVERLRLLLAALLWLLSLRLWCAANHLHYTVKAINDDLCGVLVLA